MTIPDIQTCAAMVRYDQHQSFADGGVAKPVLCGAPVAAIGPCVELVPWGEEYTALDCSECDMPADYWRHTDESDDDYHAYKPKLVHVSISEVCGGCGHSLEAHSGHTQTREAAEAGVVDTHCSQADNCRVFAPTIKEVPSDHEAVGA